MSSLFAFFGRLCSRLLLSVPESWRWGFSAFCAFWLFDILRFRRQIMLNNLKIVFPDMAESARVTLARNSLKKQIYNFLEFCLLPTIDDSWIKENVEFQGLTYLDEALKKDKGVLLLSLHLGHGDMAISMLAHLRYPLYVISKFFKVKWLNDFWFGTRSRFGANFLSPHGSSSSFDILRILKNKGILIFVLDQYMGPPFGLETTFFGVKTGTAYGLSLFSIKTGAPVLPIWTYRNSVGKNVIVIGEEIKPTVLPTRDQSLLETTQSYNQVLEKLILQHPEDWLWFHRRWKKYRSDLP